MKGCSSKKTARKGKRVWRTSYFANTRTPAATYHLGRCRRDIQPTETYALVELRVRLEAERRAVNDGQRGLQWYVCPLREAQREEGSVNRSKIRRIKLDPGGRFLGASHVRERRASKNYASDRYDSA